jgi:hypothetical protein
VLPGEELFYSHVHPRGGPAPVRRFLPGVLDLIWRRAIDPGRVFDLELPLEEAGGRSSHGRAPGDKDEPENRGRVITPFGL